jgi:hypothetical protein
MAAKSPQKRKPTRGAFTKGDPRCGRPKGRKNNVTGEVRALAQALVRDPKYMEAFRQRWREGSLPPAVEAMVWHYAWGKPHERVQVDTPGLSFTLRLKDGDADADV